MTGAYIMETKAIFILGLTMFGIVAPLPEFGSGLVFCMIAAYVTLYTSPPKDRASLWFTLLLAVFAGILTANIHRSMVPHWDLRLMMATAGAMARYAVMSAMSFGHAFVRRAEEMPKSIKFPWEK